MRGGRLVPLPRARTVAFVAVLAAALLAGAGPASAARTCSSSTSWGTNRPDLAAQVVALVNAYRSARGLPRLAPSRSLTASSVWKSLHMARYRYFAHDDPGPPAMRPAFRRARDCGYAGAVWGENIAWGYPTARAVVRGWLGSPSHRASIENPSFTTTGVGVAARPGGSLYWTQEFGSRTD